jgi:hypothetical protein
VAARHGLGELLQHLRSRLVDFLVCAVRRLDPVVGVLDLVFELPEAVTPGVLEVVGSIIERAGADLPTFDRL